MAWKTLCRAMRWGRVMNRLINQLKRHEGVRLYPYRCTAGKLTIGVGRNLDDVGISEGEAETMLWADVRRVRDDLENIEAYNSLDEIRQAVLLNMGFNLGTAGLSNFRKMWAAIEQHDYDEAARQMLDSQWAEQVGQRADELAEQMRTGEWV